MNPLVSVIIPSFNHAHFLAHAINSIIEQTYSNWEIIIVDDGSTDEIDTIVKSFLEMDKRIKYFKKKNGGLGSARNFGIQHSIGEYIYPLDADDKIKKTLLEKAVTYLDAHDTCILVNCETEAFGFYEGIIHKIEYTHRNLLLSNIIFASAMYRRKDYDRVEGYDERICYEDWDFWLRLLKDEGVVYKIPEALFMYRQHEKGSMMNELAKKGKVHDFSFNKIFSKNSEAFNKAYGNPMEIELKRQKLERELKHPLHQWVLRNKKSLFGRFLIKILK
jgi:glycosyltransferase involved in cell wall biosynthesis